MLLQPGTIREALDSMIRTDGKLITSPPGDCWPSGSAVGYWQAPVLPRDGKSQAKRGQVSFFVAGKKGSGLFLWSSSGPSCGFEAKSNGTAFGPIVIAKRQAAFDTAAKRVQFCLSLDFVHP